MKLSGHVMLPHRRSNIRRHRCALLCYDNILRYDAINIFQVANENLETEAVKLPSKGIKWGFESWSQWSQFRLRHLVLSLPRSLESLKHIAKIPKSVTAILCAECSIEERGSTPAYFFLSPNWIKWVPKWRCSVFAWVLGELLGVHSSGNYCEKNFELMVQLDILCQNIRGSDTAGPIGFRKKNPGVRYFFGKVTVESVTDATDSRKSVQQLQHNRGSDEVLSPRAWADPSP